MKRFLSFLGLCFFIATLCSCAAHPKNAPCPDYGRWCKKTPVNSWDDQ